MTGSFAEIIVTKSLKIHKYWCHQYLYTIWKYNWIFTSENNRPFQVILLNTWNLKSIKEKQHKVLPLQCYLSFHVVSFLINSFIQCGLYSCYYLGKSNKNRKLNGNLFLFSPPRWLVSREDSNRRNKLSFYYIYFCS